MNQKEIRNHILQYHKIEEILGRCVHSYISSHHSHVDNNLLPDHVYIDFFRNFLEYGYLREKSVVYDGLAKHFSDVLFEETPPELDHSGDVDYLGYVGEKAFGIQIKPTTAKANFGNYSVSERMKGSFADFTEEYTGKVFIVFSLDGEIANSDILPEIATEIERLRQTL
jgi:hypothetical protein